MNKQTPARNDPCDCGSGKKYKKCCLNRSKPASDKAGNLSLAIKTAHQFMVSQNPVSAEKEFNAALKVDKNSIEALIGLGQCLCLQWRNTEGIQFLLQAGANLINHAKKTRDVRQLLDLAYLLNNLQEPKKALPFIDVALRLVPEFPRAHHTKALVLQRIDSDSAYNSAKKAVQLAPDQSNAIILLAELESKQGDVRSAKQRLQKLIAHNSSVDLSRANRVLETVLDKLGEYDQAFSCFIQAGKLSQQREAQQIDKNAVELDLDQSTKIFDKIYLQNCVNKVSDNLPSPVFLLGFYRSGTTLMEQILGAHPDIITSDEAYIIPSVAREITKFSSTQGSIQEKIKSLSSDQILHLRQFYWQTAEQMVGQKLSGKVFIDKTTMNTLNLGLINTIFPNATVLFALRDPRDVCLSCFMQSFGLSPLTVNFLAWQETTRFYALTMNYWLSVRNHLTMSWMELKYEEILNNLESQFSPVFKKLELKWSPDCEKFYMHAKTKSVKTPSFDQVTQPIYHSSIQRWRNYERHFIEVTDNLDFFVQHLGYEK